VAGGSSQRARPRITVVRYRTTLLGLVLLAAGCGGGGGKTTTSAAPPPPPAGKLKVFVKGRIVEEGGKELADELEANGYEKYTDVTV